MVVVMDVACQSRLQLRDTGKLVQVEELRLERAEEALHRGIVLAVSFARHALRHSMLSKQASIGRHSVRPPLIQMQQCVVPILALGQGRFNESLQQPRIVYRPET